MQALLTPSDAAEILKKAPKTLEAWRQRGYGPAYVLVGRDVRYRVRDLERWLAGQTRRSTADRSARGASSPA